MTEPRGLRLAEPSRGQLPRKDLVEVFNAQGDQTYSTRTLAACLEKGLFHRAVHVWLVDFTSGGLLLRKYSSSCPKHPRRWGPTCHTEVLCYEPNTSTNLRTPGASGPRPP